MRTRIEAWRLALYHIIYQANTPAGRWFDIILIISILSSVAAIVLESVKAINQQYSELLFNIDWFFTLLFTVEYGLRIFCIHRPLKYIFSFYQYLRQNLGSPSVNSADFSRIENLIVD